MYFNNHPILTANIDDPDFLAEWRECGSSLTDKLLKAKGKVQLELISQKWVRPGWWDSYFLQIHEDLVFEREIIMKSGEIDYWYARTIIPEKCYELNPKFFYRLESESIRNLIFNEDKVSRLRMINYPVDQYCIEFSWVKKHIDNIQGILWVRLAEYSFQHTESFYLVEILFPELESVL